VRSSVSEERVCNNCSTCISHTISHITTQPSINLRLENSKRNGAFAEARVLVGALFETSWIICSFIFSRFDELFQELRLYSVE
jgi:hypothetical protein